MKTRILSILVPIFVSLAVEAANPISDSFLDLIPKRSEMVADYTREKAEKYLTTSAIHRIEGIWQFTASAVTVVIERFRSDDVPGDAVCYRMVLLRAPERTIVPGSVMGYIAPTAKRDVYDSRIYTDFDGLGFLSAKRFTITMSEDMRLSFKPEKKGVKFNFYRLLPRSLRLGVSMQDTRDASLDGCVRVFPESPDGVFEPVYL